MLIMTGSRSRLSLPLLKWVSDPVVLVEPQEADSYKSAHPSVEFETLPDRDRGFAFMVNHMIKIAAARGESHFVFSDDDVFGMRQRFYVGSKWQRVKNDLVKKSLNEALAVCKKFDLAQMAISFAAQSWGVKDAYQFNFGAWGVYIMKTDVAIKMGGFDESLPIFNDWEYSARLIKNGYKTGRTNLLSFEHSMNSLSGGAADIYKKKDIVKGAAYEVHRRYPNASRVEFNEAHGLHEIRFNWKKLTQHTK